MSDDAKALASLLDEALILTLAEAESGAAIGDHLNEIILNYSFDREDEKEYSQALVPCDMRTYVESELAIRFELSNIDLNLNTDATEAWSELFGERWKSVEYALALQIIVSVINFSLLNRSKVGTISGIKKSLFHRTTNAEHDVPVVQARLADLFSAVLTVDCTPSDLLELYTHFLEYPIYRTIESLAAQLCDPLSQAFLQFENCYHILKLPRHEGTQYTLQYFIEFNSVTSNRISTLGADIYLEIDDGKFCVSNDEFVMALFDDFEFEIGTLYSITVIIDGEYISLYVDGNFIDKIILPLGTSIMIYQVDLGSMICSFKLFRLTIFDKKLSEQSIRAIFAMGSTFRNAFDEVTDLRAVRKVLGDNFLQKRQTTSDSNNQYFDSLLEARREIGTENVCIDVDPTFLHLDDQLGNTWLSLKDQEVRSDDMFSFVSTGKCLHFKPAYLLPMFKSINCFRIILYNLENMKDWDGLFKFLSNLMTLLQNSHLRTWFKRDFGFPLLSHILTKKVQRNMKAALPIQFFNLFQEYCGWNFSNITKSVIEDAAAYQALILNFDIWYHTSTEMSASRDGVEILRFSLFQICSLLQTSEFRGFNSQELRRLGILKNMCINQHACSELYGYPGVIDDLGSEVSNVYLTLLREELTRENVQWLLQFTYFEIRSSYPKNAEAALIAFDSLFIELLENADTDRIRLITDSISPKFLLMILDEIVREKGDPLIVLRILMKRLLVNKIVYRNFVKSNGLELLFAILKNADSRYNEGIVTQLCAHSLGDYNANLDLDEMNYSSPDSETAVILKEVLILALNLLEWAVVNDISCSYPLDLDRFITVLVKRFSSNLEESTKGVIMSHFATSFYHSLTELHATLVKPQNSSIYQDSSDTISRLLSNKIINAMMGLKPEEFSRYLEIMLSSTDLKAKTLTLDDKKFNHSELSSIRLLIPSIFSGLREMGDFFSSELFNNDCMVLNFALLLQRFRQFLNLFDFDMNVYIDILECIIVCLKGAKERYDFEKLSFSSVSEVFQLSFLVVLRQSWSESQKNKQTVSDAENLESLCLILVENFEEVFTEDSRLWGIESTRVLLWALLRRFTISKPSNPITQCIGVLLKHRRDDMNVICEVGSPHGYELLAYLESLAFRTEGHRGDDQTDYKLLEALVQRNEEIVLSYIKLNLGESSNLDERFILELNAVKNTEMESRIKEVERRLHLFRNDNVVLDRKVRTRFRKIYSNFVTDKGENELLYDQQYASLVVHLEHTLALQRGSTSNCIWGLDSVQNSSAMKGHLVPVWRYVDGDETGRGQRATEEDQVTESSLQEARLINSNNSFLSYDLIPDLNPLETSIAENEDENRKILKLLKECDSIRKIWNASLIIGLEVREGVLILGELNLYFVSNYHFIKDKNKVSRLSEVPDSDRDMNISLISGSTEKMKSMDNMHDVHVWYLSDMIFIAKRPFLLRETALEILFENGTSFFFNFRSKTYRDDVCHTLDKLPKNSKIDPVLFNVLQELNTNSGSIGLRNGMNRNSLRTKFVKAFSANLSFSDGFSITQKWQNGEISNFYYLMAVNTLAGRTFNDLTQYPVFPWVIADYESEELDLKDPATFRDLSKPMGAQSRRRRAQFIERFEMLKALNDSASPPFHYGTHYSSAMIVSSFLIRLKPYVDSFLLLQGGKFGLADRLFNSIGRAWSSAAIENTTDVRELIPEFFFLPEFLINLNSFDLGKDQQGNHVNDVILPPWAKGDPKVFIAKNREALESPYVSQRLHHWIDLIFGVKQRGLQSVSAVNVFNNLSYPGAVNLDSINDENERRAITGIIHNFGQTPLQIFQDPHPERTLIDIKEIGECTWDSLPSTPQYTYQPDLKCSRARSVKYIFWESHPDGTLYWKGHPFLDVMVSSGSQLIPLKLCKPFSLTIAGNKYAMVHSCRISSFLLWKQQHFLTGDESGLIQAWKYDESKSCKLFCLGKLYGHLSEVTDIKMYSDYNALLSVDVGGSVLLWNLLDYQIIRRICSTGVHAAISQNQGNIAVYTMDKTLSIYDFGGLRYVSKTVDDEANVTCLDFINFTAVDLGSKRHAYWKEKDVLVVGYDNGKLEVYELVLHTEWELKKIKELNTGKNIEITCIKTQLRLLCINDDDFQSSREVPKLEIMAGDLCGYLHLWR